MKIVGFLALLLAILITNKEIGRANAEPEKAGVPTFVDNDFTDYQEDPSLKTLNEIDFFDKDLSSLKDLESSESNEIPNYEESKLLQTVISSDNASTSLESVLNMIKELDPKTAKAYLRAKREVSPLDLASVGEDVESRFKIIENMNHTNAKEFLKARREARFLDESPVFLENYIKSTYRRKTDLTPRQKKAAKKKAIELKKKNDIQLSEIMEFLEPNYMSTNYVYQEVQRIKKSGKVRDKLRLLVLYLEHEHHERLTSYILKCFHDGQKIEKPNIDIWKNRITNNLLIHPLKDHHNGGQ